MLEHDNADLICPTAAHQFTYKYVAGARIASMYCKR